MLRCVLPLLVLLVSSCLAAPNEGRISGGQVVPDGQYPYMCSVRVRGNHECGCVIISADYVLTSARCVDVTLESSLSVYVGATHVYSGGLVYDVQTVTKHEGYIQNSLSSSDIALCKLRDPLTMTDMVQAVTLPVQADPVPAGNGIVLGWGWSANVGPISPDLLEIPERIYTVQECLDMYLGTTTDSQVCAEGLSAEQGLCNKDMGGPLMANGVLVGLGSWLNSDCSTIGAPAVFTRVSMYRDWILTNSGV